MIPGAKRAFFFRIHNELYYSDILKSYTLTLSCASRGERKHIERKWVFQGAKRPIFRINIKNRRIYSEVIYIYTVLRVSRWKKTFRAQASFPRSEATPGRNASKMLWRQIDYMDGWIHCTKRVSQSVFIELVQASSKERSDPWMHQIPKQSTISINIRQWFENIFFGGCARKPCLIPKVVEKLLTMAMFAICNILMGNMIQTHPFGYSGVVDLT